MESADDSFRVAVDYRQQDTSRTIRDASSLFPILDIDNVGYGTATLLLTLARPDRLRSLNTIPERVWSAIADEPFALGDPENYRKLLRWLYRQRWYKDGPPMDEGLVRIWRFRAALVDAFVCEPP